MKIIFVMNGRPHFGAVFLMGGGAGPRPMLLYRVRRGLCAGTGGGFVLSLDRVGPFC